MIDGFLFLNFLMNLEPYLYRERSQENSNNDFCKFSKCLLNISHLSEFERLSMNIEII